MKTAREILYKHTKLRSETAINEITDAMKEYAEQAIDKCSQKVGVIKLTEGEVSMETILKVKELLK